MVHHSAIFLIPFVLLSDRPFGEKTKNFLIVLSIIVIFMSLFMANSINTIANDLFSQFTDEFDTYKRDTIGGVVKIGIFTLPRWFMLGYLLFVTLKYTKVNFGDARTVCVKIAAIFFMIGFLPGVMLIDRITYNLAFPAIIGITSIVNEMTDKKEKTIYICMAVLYGIWEIYLMLNSPIIMAAHSSYKNILFQ